MALTTRASRVFGISAATTVVGLSIAALTGCSSASSTPTATPTVTVTVTASPTPTATSSSSPTSTASAGATPVDIACDQLVFDSIVTDFSPGLVANPSYTPTSGSDFQTIAGLGGTVCRWDDSATGGSATLTVGVAKPSAAGLASQEATIASTGYTTTDLPGSPANRGYEATQASIPELDMFTSSGYWIAVASPGFTKAGDASTFFQNVLQTLPSG